MNILRRIGWWFRHRRHEAELAEELAHHEELKQRELEARGLVPAAAVAARRRAMGNATYMREESRGIWIWPWLDHALQDIRYALRSARRSPTFSLGVVAITALGIGATTTMFSVVDGVLLRPLPYPAAKRLIYFDWGSHSPPKYRDWRRAVSSVELWAAGWATDQDLTGSGRPERLNAALITPDFFRLFGARPGLGRLFSADDFQGDGASVILGRRFWLRRFGGDSSVVGKTIQVGGRAVVVAGVLADGFVEPEEIVRRPTDVWLPLDLDHGKYTDGHFQILSVAARLREGVTIEAARRELALVAVRLAASNPELYDDRDGKPSPIPILPLHQAIVRQVDRALLTLLAAVGLMLLIACANVINLYLARGTDRFREMAVRTALGAGRGRLVRQLVAESVTLGVLAGLLGTALAMAGVRGLAAIYPGTLPRAGDIQVDARALAFAVAASIVTGLVFGLVPAWAFGEGRVHGAIKAGGPMAGRRRGRLRAAMVVAEVALALMLLVGSGLLFHSFLEIVRVDPGFDPKGLAVAQVIMGDKFTPERRLAFAKAVEERARNIPGVADAAVGVVSPMIWFGGSHCCWNSRGVTLEDGRELEFNVLLHPVGSRYFEAIGARLRGAGFAANERFAEPWPVVVSTALAERMFGGADPLGRRFAVGGKHFQIRGVVSGLRQYGLDAEAGREAYLPYQAFGGEFDRLSIIARTAGSAAALVPALRDAIWAVDPTMPADEIHTMTEQLGLTLAAPRFYGTLMGAFGVLALALAAGGVYASMLYSVRQRSRELGIRVALGAKRRDILGMVVREAGRLGVVGLVLGGIGAAALTRLLGSFLFGIAPGDPITFAAAVAVLAVTILGAAYFPARRAGASDALTVLRSD